MLSSNTIYKVPLDVKSDHTHHCLTISIVSTHPTIMVHAIGTQTQPIEPSMAENMNKEAIVRLYPIMETFASYP
jgi:hypothetical protein